MVEAEVVHRFRVPASGLAPALSVDITAPSRTVDAPKGDAGQLPVTITEKERNRVINTPDEQDAPVCGGRTGKLSRRMRGVLLIVVLLIAGVIGGAHENPVPFLGALIVYVVDNVSLEAKGRAKEFLADMLQSLIGCRACPA
ncbi:hypothetical protein OUQ99_10685 [Streptomonospora nanhaiensis]|uniref:Uncharacterized protein n=1 Tax=Streptomonospora nanhaiensis TaxID=1323731 RepID=A0ABY6YU26_9ACTN|nr:hypothetical protein [Streptomonospora nanhaiensis]WAE75506.1 hypothetical protein OUQ99_10685 [Streptomonospora nanhaiensis]